MTSLIYYGLTLIRFYGQRGRSRISIKLDSHTLLALFSCPPLVFGVGLKKSKMFFSPQWKDTLFTKIDNIVVVLLFILKGA